MVGIVPIRSGSKSIPNKNIKDFLGKPLVYWVLKALEESNVDCVILSTDEPSYIEIVRSFGFNKIKYHLRSKKNSTDSASTESAMLEIIDYFEIDDDIMLCQATSPLTNSKDINLAIEFYRGFDSILSVVKKHTFIWSIDGNSLNYDYKNRPRRQDFESSYCENGCIYISHSNRIIKSKNRISGKIGIYEMHPFTGFEIDEPSDWDLIEFLFQKINDKNS